MPRRQRASEHVTTSTVKPQQTISFMRDSNVERTRFLAATHPYELAELAKVSASLHDMVSHYSDPVLDEFLQPGARIPAGMTKLEAFLTLPFARRKEFFFMTADNADAFVAADSETLRKRYDNEMPPKVSPIFEVFFAHARGKATDNALREALCSTPDIMAGSNYALIAFMSRKKCQTLPAIFQLHQSLGNHELQALLQSTCDGDIAHAVLYYAARSRDSEMLHIVLNQYLLFAPELLQSGLCSCLTHFNYDTRHHENAHTLLVHAEALGLLTGQLATTVGAQMPQLLNDVQSSAAGKDAVQMLRTKLACTVAMRHVMDKLEASLEYPEQLKALNTLYQQYLTDPSRASLEQFVDMLETITVDQFFTGLVADIEPVPGQHPLLTLFFDKLTPEAKQYLTASVAPGTAPRLGAACC